MKADLSIVVRAISPIIRDYVASALSGLSERLMALEQREPVHGKDGAQGEPGRDGKDADSTIVEALKAEIATLRAELSAQKNAPPWTLPDVAGMVASEVVKAIAALPPARDGRDGVSIDPAVVDVMVAAHVEKAVALIPIPKDGTSLTPADVQPLIAEEVEKAVKFIPVPKDGVGLAGALIDRDGQLVLTLSDGSTKALGHVVGRDVDVADVERIIKSELASWPRPTDGKDGLGFDDLSVEYDGERTFTFKFTRGDQVKSFPFKLPFQLYKKLWDAERQYDTGDVVTWGGSQWTALKDSRGIAPDTRSSEQFWALSCMRGKQGKQGEKGEPGMIGKQGPMGPQGKSGY